MSVIKRENNRYASLLSDTNLVQAPFVRVSINGYTFGVYEEKKKGVKSQNGVVEYTATKFPNYVNSLSVKKINGTVNQYSLNIVYPIADGDDPNFFDKIFSEVSNTRLIYFSYGDFMVPGQTFRDEEAIITSVKETFSLEKSQITYDVSAVSTTSLSLSGTYRFPAVYDKPSNVIKSLLKSNKYGLTDVFTGMKSSSVIEQYNLIASDDKPTTIPTCLNMSVLEYISTCVSYMTPLGSTNNSMIKSGTYSLTTYDDTDGTFGGAYFKVQKRQTSVSVLNQLCTYEIDIGYLSSNVVSSFTVDQNDNWSIYYNYNRSLDHSDYLKRINDKGEDEYIYSPQIAKGKFEVESNDATWWSNVTQFPIKASVTIQGLLRPVVLMQYVKLNVWLAGHKHITSGFYIITEQNDTINSSGYKTKLSLLRVAPDEEIM